MHSAALLRIAPSAGVFLRAGIVMYRFGTLIPQVAIERVLTFR